MVAYVGENVGEWEKADISAGIHRVYESEKCEHEESL